MPMYGQRRDVTVKERFHDGNGDAVNLKLRETHYGNAPGAATVSPLPSPAAAPALGKHVLKIKQRIKERSPKKNAAAPTATIAKTTILPPPPVFVAPPMTVTTIGGPVLPSLTAPPLLNTIAPTLPPLNTSPPSLPEFNAQDGASTAIIIDTPPIPEAINGTQVTPQPPLVPAAEITAPPLLPFQYLPEHTYIAYDPVRFASLPPAPLPPPVISTTTYVVHDSSTVPAVAPNATTTTTSTTSSNSNNGRRINIRIKEKLTGNAGGTEPARRQFKLRERIRTKA